MFIFPMGLFFETSKCKVISKLSYDSSSGARIYINFNRVRPHLDDAYYRNEEDLIIRSFIINSSM